MTILEAFNLSKTDRFDSEIKKKPNVVQKRNRQMLIVSDIHKRKTLYLKSLQSSQKKTHSKVIKSWDGGHFLFELHYMIIRKKHVTIVITIQKKRK